MEKAIPEKGIKLQKQHDQKKYLTPYIQDIRGLFKSKSKVEVICRSNSEESNIKVILKNQIFFM